MRLQSFLVMVACFWPLQSHSGWVVISEFRRRVNVPVYRSPAPAMGPRFDAVEQETAAEKIAAADPPRRRSAASFAAAEGFRAIGAARGGSVRENEPPFRRKWSKCRGR